MFYRPDLQNNTSHTAISVVKTQNVWYNSGQYTGASSGGAAVGAKYGSNALGLPPVETAYLSYYNTKSAVL